MTSAGSVARIAVIGVGGIGSRHLQSLARLNTPARIEIFDPSPIATKTALERWAQMPRAAGHEVVAVRSPREFARSLDVAIVATSADVRLSALRAVLEHREVRFAILEKFLFQSLEDYHAAKDAVTSAGTLAVVNTGRRMWPGYRAAKKDLAEEEMLICRASGAARYGVGTTAIHFLDLASFLSGQRDFDARGDRLTLAPGEARRAGFIEFGGAIEAMSLACSFEYATVGSGTSPVLVELSSPRRRLLVRESEGRAWRAREEDDWRWNDVPFATALQSEMTYRAVEDLLAQGCCELPTLQESSSLHETLLIAMLGALERLTGESATTCPIT